MNFRSVIAAIVCIACGYSSARAQTSGGGGESRQRFQAAFEATLADPSSLDKAFRFASIAIEAGDLEAAVGVLERMLIVNPDLPRVRLELGVLYYRLGSFEVARTYLQAALATPDMPAQVRERALGFLAEIDKQREPGKLSGSAMFGFRHQTNANAAPDGGNVRLFGLSAVLDARSNPTADASFFAVASLVHRYDLGTQSHDTIETRALVYSARQFTRQDVGLLYASASTGPRLAALPGAIEGMWLRPSVAFDFALLGDAPEFASPGAGLSIDKRIGDGLASIAFDWRRRFYQDSGPRPLNSARDGNEYAARGSIDQPVTPWLALSAGAGYVRFAGFQNYNAYNEWTLSAGATLTHDLFGWVPRAASSLTLGVAHVWSDYDAPDATVDPSTTRSDREWRLSATLAVPVFDALSVVGQFGYSIRASSLPNYAYDNLYGTLAIAWRF